MDSKPKKTDIHWRSTNGEAAWNWRMKWPITIPSDKQPRLRLQVWDKDVLNPNDAICEAILNLKGFYNKTKHKKLPYNAIEKQWVDLTHPNYEGVQGRMLLTIQLFSQSEAIAKSAGVGQEEPNRFPHLPPPVRPETSFNPFRLDKQFCLYFKKYRIYCIIALVILFLLVVVLPLVLKFA